MALNELLGGGRISRDIDLFHDTEAAVETAWDEDRQALEGARYAVELLRARPGFFEAEVTSQDQSVRMEWARDSAFRFFPLVEHPDLGLALHPFDLATNKLLALIGRREPRDWVDLLVCDRALQPLGYLAWAASGKDPGFSPRAVLDQCARSGRYSAAELQELVFEGDPPAEETGRCVLSGRAELCVLSATDLEPVARGDALHFHPGTIGGAWPTLRPDP